MSDKEQAQIRDMANRLISTLDTLMPSEKADAIVREVATELYTDVLGLKGQIVQNSSGFAHGVWGKNGKKSAIRIATYEFKETK